MELRDRDAHSISLLSSDAYDAYVSRMRLKEYPMLLLDNSSTDDNRISPNNHTASTETTTTARQATTTTTTYLDHAATTPPSASLLSDFHSSLLGTFYGNPHSSNNSNSSFVSSSGGARSGTSAAASSTHLIDEVRVSLLRFVNADPAAFDVVFTANATAGIKLVGEALRDYADLEESGVDGAMGFELGVHCEAHTSLIGLREWARRTDVLVSDAEVEDWLDSEVGDADEMCDVEEDDRDGRRSRERGMVRLFAYPAQSNLTGRRLPLEWAHRATKRRRCDTLAGRTTNEVKTISQRRRTYTLLDAAAYASTALLDLSNANAVPDFTVLSLYKIFGMPDLGALIVKKDAAPLLRQRRYFGGGTVDMVVCLQESWHAKKSGALHEQLEDGTLPVHSIVALRSALRTHEKLFGSMGRISRHTTDLAQRLYEGLSVLKHGNGERICTIYRDTNSVYGDPLTQGPIIAFNMQDSKGTWISTVEVEKLASIQNIQLRTGGVCNPGGIATALNLAPWEMRTNFSAGHRCGGENDIANGKPTGVIRLSLGAMSTRQDVERFIEFVADFFVDQSIAESTPAIPIPGDTERHRLEVESLTVYPIKSCGAFQIQPGVPWEIRPEGLAWDREWCVVHRGTEKALSQKQHPRMALLRPRLDFEAGLLRVGMIGRYDEITISLSRNPALYKNNTTDYIFSAQTDVCGDAVETLTYISPAIAEFFSKSLDVPCTLARFTKAGSRHCKPHLQTQSDHKFERILASAARPILMSNESPILTISRSSLNALNARILAEGGKEAHPAVFRANIVLRDITGDERPWAEDSWAGMRIGGLLGPQLEFLGGCRRCQMVCVDQDSAERNAEPFVTLAKTRRFNGNVLFGVHTALVSSGRNCTVRVGDMVEAFGREL